MEQYPMFEEKKSNLLLGIAGALLGALLGALVWAIVGAFGYIASIVGLLIAFLAAKGYDLLRGPQGIIKLIVLIFCVILAVSIGNAGAYLWAVHAGYTEAVSEMGPVEQQLVMSEAEYLRSVLPELVNDPQIQQEFLKDMGVGLLFAVVGCIGLLKQAGKKSAPSPEQHPAEESDSPAE